LALSYTEEAAQPSCYAERARELHQRALLGYLKAAREHPELALIYERAERSLSQLTQCSPSTLMLDEVQTALTATVKVVGTSPSCASAGNVHILLGDVLLQQALATDALTDETANQVGWMSSAVLDINFVSHLCVGMCVNVCVRVYVCVCVCVCLE
jgi:hypothetical protein